MYFSFLGPTSSTKQYVMNRITLNAFLLPTCKISQLGKWPWSACQPLRCQFCAWRACSQVSNNKYNGRKYFVLKYVQLFKKQLLLILNHKGDMNPGLQKETPVYDLSNHPNQLLTQTVLVLLTSTLEVQEVMLEGSLQLTRLLYWKHWARLLKKKRTKNWYGKSATAIIGNNACAGWAISAVKTKQGEGDKTGTCFCVYHILRLWLCYDGDTENELNIINFFDMFKENSSNKFKVKANMFSESKRKMRLSNSINSSTVSVH